MGLTLAEQQLLDTLFQKLLPVHGFRPDSLPDSVSSILQGNLASTVVIGNPLANVVTIAGAGAGSSPTVTMSGTDTNVGLTFITKGNGKFQFNTSTLTGVALNLAPDGSNNGFVWNPGTGRLLCTAHFEEQGNLYVNQNISLNSTGNLIQVTGPLLPLKIIGNSSDNASALNLIVDGTVPYTNAAAKIASFRNGGTEKRAIDLNGKEIIPTGGAADVVGTATLTAGSSGAIATTAATASSKIYLSRKTQGAAPGHLSYTVVAGTSFTITSSSGTDTGQVDWEIKN